MKGIHHRKLQRFVRHPRFDSLKARWTAWVALFIVALLYEALPKVFYWGPRGLLLALVTVLIVPIVITHWRNDSYINRVLSLGVNILITLYTIISVSRIVFATLQGQIGPKHLLISSIILWGTNILVFALWYWNLDAGGPNKRDLKENKGIQAFLFPQMQISLKENPDLANALKNWEPNFLDYLFLAFNTSTAFSPTDTPVLSRWAKCMNMTQALISLTIILMLAARAINLLSPASSYFVS